MRSPLLCSLVAALGLVACASSVDDAIDGEPVDQESAIVPITQPDETAPDDSLAPQSNDHEATDLIDVRGVGDSGWSKTHERTPLRAEFGAALDKFNPGGDLYRGDLSFINWETVVGTSCSRFGSAYVAGRSYAFVSRAENLTQAYERGFNLVGLSNNHTRDCHGSEDTDRTGEAASPDMTARAIEGLGDLEWLTAGVGSTTTDDSAQARVRTFMIKGRQVRVAFGSIYTGRPDCPNAACSGDMTSLFSSLRDARADLRILAMHSMAAADQDTLVRKAVEFVESYGGDVVFGHGPHVWKPVRVVRKKAGTPNSESKGVIFESLGNFIHPSLGAQSKNYIGRALFEPQTFKLRQVQLVPIANAGAEVRPSAADAKAVEANLRWTPSPDNGRGAVYANVAQ